MNAPRISRIRRFALATTIPQAAEGPSTSWQPFLVLLALPLVSLLVLQLLLLALHLANLLAL